MSEIVKNEMDAIAAFAEDTEKRRSTLTLNELNYISDKQLHKKDSGGSGGFESCKVTFVNFTNQMKEPFVYIIFQPEWCDAPYANFGFTEDELPVLKNSWLYDNTSFCNLNDDTLFQITGDYRPVTEAEDWEGAIVVLGDTTITYIGNLDPTEPA